MDPKTPVLVGAGAIRQRADDPTQASEAVALMVAALEAAADDAETRALIRGADSIRVPRGNWAYPDPGRWVADRIGATAAKTTLAEIGVMQQTLISDACRAIADGAESIALIVGAEAKYREASARRAGIAITDSDQAETTPDYVMRPKEPLMHDIELQRGLMMPVRAFGVMESAMRFADQQSIEAHEVELAKLMESLNRVASTNPCAWSPEKITADDVLLVTSANRRLSLPYSKLHASNWTVDQAAGLILCSVEVARELGIAESRWVYPHSAAESWHVVPVVQRAALHRCMGAAHAGGRALELAHRSIDRVEHLDLYSCFPVVVRMWARELGVSPGRELTVTGGMVSGGGPLNNYVLQATARMADVLRARPGEFGLTTCISGFANKLGAAVWSTDRPKAGFNYANVTAEVEADTPVREVTADYQGRATIAGYTVVYHGETPIEAVAVCDVPGGNRTLAITRDPERSASWVRGEQCGREISIGPGGEIE